MRHSTTMGIVFLLLVQGLAGCDNSRSSTPAAPSPTLQPVSPPGSINGLIVFTELASGFSTTDLRDAHDRIVQFNTAGELIWTVNGTHLPGFQVDKTSYPGSSFISGRICPEGCSFEVRFGTKDGERRAYLTVDYGHSNTGTLVDVDVAGGTLVVTQTKMYAPGTFTLSGTVTEVTPTGQVPVEGAWVDRLVVDGWRAATTDRNGVYSMSGMYDGISTVAASKDGYQQQEVINVPIQGDTRFDIQLVRR
jgi:hypothetical protein